IAYYQHFFFPHFISQNAGRYTDSSMRYIDCRVYQRDYTIWDSQIRCSQQNNRGIKGLLPLITHSIFERIVVLATMDFFIATSFTKNTRMRSAMPPGINEIRNIDFMSMY